MAFGSPFGSIAAAVAAVGAIYEAAHYYSTHHHDHHRHHRQGFHCNDEADLKNNEQKTYKVKEMAVPKFAPEFDGLHCFETFVIR